MILVVVHRPFFFHGADGDDIAFHVGARLFAILNHMIGTQEPPLTGPVTLPGTQKWAADANGDTLINIIDLMKCINIAVGVCDPKVAVAEVEVGDVVGLAGRRVAVPVDVSSEQDIAGLLLRFAYDQRSLEPGEPDLCGDLGRLELAQRARRGLVAPDAPVAFEGAVRVVREVLGEVTRDERHFVQRRFPQVRSSRIRVAVSASRSSW